MNTIIKEHYRILRPCLWFATGQKIPKAKVLDYYTEDAVSSLIDFKYIKEENFEIDDNRNKIRSGMMSGLIKVIVTPLIKSELVDKHSRVFSADDFINRLLTELPRDSSLAYESMKKLLISSFNDTIVNKRKIVLIGYHPVVIEALNETDIRYLTLPGFMSPIDGTRSEFIDEVPLGMSLYEYISEMEMKLKGKPMKSRPQFDDDDE